MKKHPSKKWTRFMYRVIHKLATQTDFGTSRCMHEACRLDPYGAGRLLPLLTWDVRECFIQKGGKEYPFMTLAKAIIDKEIIVIKYDGHFYEWDHNEDYWGFYYEPKHESADLFGVVVVIDLTMDDPIICSTDDGSMQFFRMANSEDKEWITENGMNLVKL